MHVDMWICEYVNMDVFEDVEMDVSIWMCVDICKGCKISFEYKFAFASREQNKTSYVQIKTEATVARHP